MLGHGVPRGYRSSNCRTAKIRTACPRNRSARVVTGSGSWPRSTAWPTLCGWVPPPARRRTSAPGCTGPIRPGRPRTPCPAPPQRWPPSPAEQLSPSTAGDTGPTFPIPDHAGAFAVLPRFGGTVCRKARGIGSSLPRPDAGGLKVAGFPTRSARPGGWAGRATSCFPGRRQAVTRSRGRLRRCRSSRRQPACGTRRRSGRTGSRGCHRRD
jgi:hypothetical protein